MIKSSPELLVKYIRDGLVEQAHFGFILVSNGAHIIDSNGESNNYPFYLVWCIIAIEKTSIG